MSSELASLFNDAMNIKTFAAIGLAVCIFNGVALGQTIQITGRVTGIDNSKITLQSGTDRWTINRSSTTSVTSGSLSLGSTVTVKCNSPDAHKNEGASLGASATPPPE